MLVILVLELYSQKIDGEERVVAYASRTSSAICYYSQGDAGTCLGTQTLPAISIRQKVYSTY